MRWLIGILFVISTACTPAEIEAFLTVTEPARTAAAARGLDAAGMERLRWCESRGDYTITSRTGTYRGAYQFHQRTWNAVAARHYPWLVGRDPASVEWWWQDAMAQALWSEAGRQPWPTCGRRV